MPADALPIKITVVFRVADIDLATVVLKRADGLEGDNFVSEVGPPVDHLICDRGDPDVDKGSSGGNLVADCFGADGLPGQDGVLDKEGGTLDGIDDIDVRFTSLEVADLIRCENVAKGTILPVGGLVVMGNTLDGTPFFSEAVPDVGIDQLLVQSKNN